MKRMLMTVIGAVVISLGVVSVSDAFWGKKAQEAPAVAADVKAAVRAEAPAPPAVEVKEAVRSEASTAAEPAKEKEEVEAAPVPPPPISDAEMAKKRAQKDKKRTDIDGNQWEVSVIAMSGEGEKTMDVLVFKDNKFSSREYVKKGYVPSNYTISLADDGRAVVETMQSEEKLGICFWRIEFDEKIAGLTGVLSRQLSENRTDDYSFVSTAKNPIVKE